MGEKVTFELLDHEMEMLHNAMHVYLQYLKDLQFGVEIEEEGGDPVENSIALSDVLIESYVDAKQLRQKLVNIVGRDLSPEG